MADYYTHFSDIIGDLSHEEEDWCKSHLERLESLEDNDECEQMTKMYLDVECAPDFSWEIIKGDDGKSGLWICDSGGGGDIFHVEVFVKEFLRVWRPSSCWSMTWAMTCSKPRIGAFTGGAIFVTKDAVHFINADAWAQKKEDEWKAKIKSA